MRYAAFILLFSSLAFAQTPATRPAGLPRCTVRVPTTTITFDMVKIPAGQVEWAPDKPGGVKRIENVKPIWVATTEMTWDPYVIWARCEDLRKLGAGLEEGLEAMNKEVNARTRPSSSFMWYANGIIVEGDPVRGTTYASTQLYCKWLAEKCGRRFRLPTEAEWEYACRAGGPPVAGLDTKQLDPLAWFRDNSATDEFPDGTAHKPASKQPNVWGLYDMLGNVSEWVEQADAPAPYAKGGSFRDKAARMKSSDREHYRKSWQRRDPQDPPSKWQMSDANWVGFRIVCDDDPLPTPPSGR